jgi:DNA modification methylase
MKELTEKIQGMCVPRVILPTASALDTGLADSSVDLAVTSPPYINAVDYPRTHQLEMYWLGLLGDGPLSKVKRKYIGTETVYKNEYQELKRTGHKTLDPILEKIFNLDPRRSFIVYKFFEDMEIQLEEMKRVLRPGGRYCIAIGNNLIRGIRVKSHEILAEIAESTIGFELEKIFFSKLIRHFIRIPRRERMHGEWVLILKKPA